MTEKGITNRGPKKRDATCFRVQHAITIPAGTILRQEPGKEGIFTCPVAHGKLVVERSDAEAWTDQYQKVIA